MVESNLSIAMFLRANHFLLASSKNASGFSLRRLAMTWRRPETRARPVTVPAEERLPLFVHFVGS